MINRLYSVLIFHNAVEKEGDMKRLPVKKIVFKLALIGIQATKQLRKTAQCLNFEDMLSTTWVQGNAFGIAFFALNIFLNLEEVKGNLMSTSLQYFLAKILILRCAKKGAKKR